MLRATARKPASGFEKVYKLDANALRAVEAYGRWASRKLGKDEALKIYEAFDKVLPQHPLIVEAMDEIKDGEKLPPLVDSPQAGAAEVLFGLGTSLGRQGGEDLALAYLQLAIYLAPRHPLALMSLADLYESIKKPALALKVYQRVPADSPLKRNAEIQLATNLDALERTDEAKKILERLIAEQPNDLEAIMALGNILRVRKEFAECADVYGKGIDTLKNPQTRQLADLLFPRHLQRALEAVGERGGRLQARARTVPRSGARAELSRLFVDRPGRQSRRGHADDPPRRRAAAGRRLHRGFARLGPLPHPATTTRR